MKTPSEIATMLDTAYRRLSTETENAYETTGNLIEIERLVAQERARILTSHDPKELGSNEAARNAKIEEMLGAHLATRRDAEDDVRLSKHCLELARIEVEGARALLRCLELAGTATVQPLPVVDGSQEPPKRTSRRKKADPAPEPTKDTQPEAKPAQTPVETENSEQEIKLTALMAQLDTLPKPPFTMTDEQKAEYKRITSEIQEIKPGWADPLLDDIMATNAKQETEPNTDPVPKKEIVARDVCGYCREGVPLSVDGKFHVYGGREHEFDACKYRIATMTDEELIAQRQALPGSAMDMNYEKLTEANALDKAIMDRGLPPQNKPSLGEKVPPEVMDALTQPTPEPAPEPPSETVEDIGDGINF